MNIIGLPLIYLVFRYWSFSKIMPFDLPGVSSEEYEQMISYSKKALWIIAAFFLLALGVGTQSLPISNGVALIGIAIAVYFDLRAEGIKRRGKVGAQS